MSESIKNTFWYAIYTMPNMEKKCAESLLNKGIISYCPLQKVQRQWADRKKILEVPAFKGYVFVHIHDEIRWQVLATKGVLNFVCIEGKPARIPLQEMETVKRFFRQEQEVLLDIPEIQHGDMVTINAGPLMGATGKVVDIEYKLVTLQIPSLGFTLQVKMKATDLIRSLKIASA